MSHYSLMFFNHDNGLNLSKLVDCIVPSTLKAISSNSICVTTQHILPATGERNCVITKVDEIVIGLDTFNTILFIDNFTLRRTVIDARGVSSDDIVDNIITHIVRANMQSLTGIYDFTMNLHNGDTIRSISFGCEIRLIDSLLYMQDVKINLNQVDSIDIICKCFRGTVSWHRLCKPTDELYDYFDCFCPRANSVSNHCS